MIQITNEKKNKLIIAGAFASVLSLSVISANMKSEDVCKAKALEVRHTIFLCCSEFGLR